MTAVLGWTGRILLWLVILLACVVLLVAVVVPRVTGSMPYTILTGSMQPALSPGTLAVMRPVDGDQIAVGDVITYQLRSGRPEVVTHRVISQGVNGTGELMLRTQGDANGAPDQGWVREVQVRGKLWYAVPYLGYASSVVTGRQHQLLVYAAAGALLVYAVIMFGSAIRDRRGRVPA